MIPAHHRHGSRDHLFYDFRRADRIPGLRRERAGNADDVRFPFFDGFRQSVPGQSHVPVTVRIGQEGGAYVQLPIEQIDREMLLFQYGCDLEEADREADRRLGRPRKITERRSEKQDLHSIGPSHSWSTGHHLLISSFSANRSCADRTT